MHMEGVMPAGHVNQWPIFSLVKTSTSKHLHFQIIFRQQQEQESHICEKIHMHVVIVDL